jgi:outer membrane receptor protein involved in Fe transport
MTNRFLAGSAVIALVAVFAAGPALAQSADTNADSRNEAALNESDIVVTAQRREERLIDVPISIVAISGRELEKRKLVSIDELANVVPGLAIQSNGESRQYQLRGLGNVVGSSPSVGVYLDEAPVTGGPISQLDLQLHDLARVEVLRGPQGTLYGEGSLGGTIRFITNDPDLNDFGFETNAQASVTKGGSPSQQIKSVLNLPLINDQLGLRVAASLVHDGGWIDQPAADRNDYNGSNLINVRAKLLWQPTDALAINAMAVVHHNDGSFQAGEDRDGNFTQSYGRTDTPSLKDRYQIYNLTATYDFAGARLLSTSTYVDYSKNLENFARQVRYNPEPAPRSPYQASFSNEVEAFTQELRLTSTGSGPLQWTIGGLYRDTHSTNPGILSTFALSWAPGDPIPPAFRTPATDDRSKSWAIFGDANYEIADRLTLGVGLRYFEDRREDVAGQRAKFDTLNPRFYAKYALSDDANIFASVAKGFRSGGFNAPGQSTYEPETVWTYEVGTKLSLADRTVNLELTAFQSEYKGYQITGVQPAPGTAQQLDFFTSNAGDARIRGIEGSLTWRPSNLWTVSFKGDYLNHKFVRIGPFSPPPHIVGDRLDLVPNYGFTASIERAFEIGERSGYVRLDYNQKGKITYRNRTVGFPLEYYKGSSDVINLLNLALNLKWNENLSFDVFAQNILNERGYLDPYSLDLNGARARPLTVGAGFSARF